MAKAKDKKKKKAGETDAPKIVTMKGGLTQAQFASEVLVTMEDDLRISKAQARDFIDSLKAVTERELGEGNPVNLFGLVKISPRFHTKGQRMVNEVFGDPESKKIVKKYPAKVTVKATVFKAVKDALPSVAKLGKLI
jgi:nucleoid DNA-binding protein